MKKIIMVISVMLFLVSLSYADNQAPLTGPKNASVTFVEQVKNQADSFTEVTQSNHLFQEIWTQIINQPINLIIVVIGIIALILNLFCGWQSKKTRKDLIKDIKEFKLDNSITSEDISLECLLGIKSTSYSRKVLKVAQFIKDIDKGISDSQGWVTISNNVYFAIVDILPLCGIAGTLLAIAEQAFGRSGLNTEELKNTLGLAIFSTLIALSFTIICKLCESGWIDNIRYIKDLREIFSLYHLNLNKAHQASDSLNIEKGSEINDKISS